MKGKRLWCSCIIISKIKKTHKNYKKTIGSGFLRLIQKYNSQPMFVRTLSLSPIIFGDFFLMPPQSWVTATSDGSPFARCIVSLITQSVLSHRNRSSNFPLLYLLCIHYCVSFEIEEGVVHVWGEDYVSRRHPWMISTMAWTKKWAKLFCSVDPQLRMKMGVKVSLGDGTAALRCCPVLFLCQPLRCLWLCTHSL